MKKILLLIGFVLMMTGCKVEYNLIILEDLKIEESVNMTASEEIFNNYYKKREGKRQSHLPNRDAT